MLLLQKPMFLSRLWRQCQLTCLPPMCILCGDHTSLDALICSACKRELPILSHSCAKCAELLSIYHSHSHPHAPSLCGACLKNPPPFDNTHALFVYAAPIIQLIIQLKFQRQLSHAAAINQFFIHAIKEQWYKNKPLPDIIIPMPLHPHRLKERGFNQAFEIIRSAAKILKIPIDLTGIKRIKPTAPQTTLSAHARRQNMLHAFIATRNYHQMTVAVVDDVITTGATVAACCYILKQKGAKTIDVWCCARRTA